MRPAVPARQIRGARDGLGRRRCAHLCRAASIVTVAVLIGCASVPADYWQPGWRVYGDSQIFVHYVKAEGIAAYCSPIVVPRPSLQEASDMSGVHGCTHRLAEACNIYIREDLRDNACLLEHERRHCKGWDHPSYPSFHSIVC